ncbi:MAG: hypothetical protein IH986_12045 [Planctomycetes bacterium]|nr:hypothetical protein [Planctomycetota bacterium]
MEGKTARKERLHELIDLACIHRGWSRAELARALKRDPTKLYPESGNPKMDFLIALADVIEWSIDDVAKFVSRGKSFAPEIAEGAEFESLDRAAKQTHQRGEFAKMVELARQMYFVAKTPEERARACNREHGGWDGRGRYTKALEAVCRGLREEHISTRRRLQLQTNLANTHYTLWELSSAHAHAHVVLEWYAAHPPGDVVDRKNHAFAFFVRGHTFRRRALRDLEQTVQHCRQARSDLETAARLYRELSAELNDERLAGVAHTCEAGLIEVDVGLGLREPPDAVDELWGRLKLADDEGDWPVGDWLESYGWTCIMGANIALRYLTGRAQDRALGKFTNKALQIADRLDNWALRERVLEMDFRLHKAQCEATDLDLPYTIDHEDMRLIVGAMGRFPIFHETGWEILQTAKIVSDARRN